MNPLLRFLNQHFLLTFYGIGTVYFIILLWLRLQIQFQYSDELLILYAAPILYAANRFTKRVYIPVTVFVAFASIIIIYYASPNYFTSILSFICVMVPLILICELVFISNKKAKETAANLKITLQSIGDAVISTNRSGQIVYMNPVAEKLTGWTVEQAVGKPCSDIFKIINSHTRQPCQNPIDKVIKSGGIEGLANDTVLIAKNGFEMQIADSAAPIVDDYGNCTGVVLIFRDVTVEYQSRNEITESRKLLKIFVENTPAAVAMLDKNLCYMAYSKRWLSDYNLGERDLTGLHHYDLFPEIRKLPVWMDVHQRCLAGAVERKDEELFVREDGTANWLRWEVRPWRDANDEIGGILLLTEDISARKRAELALEQSEKLYRRAIEVADAVPYYQNYLTNQYEFVGSEIQKLTGYSSEEFTPELWVSIEKEIDLLNDLHGLTVHDAIDKAKSGEGISWRADYKIKTRSGETKWLANAAIQVKDEQGIIIGSLGILQDITDRKLAEQSLFESQNRLVEAQRIAKMGDFTWNVGTGEVTWSSALYDLLKYDRSENINADFVMTKVQHPEDSSRVMNWLNECISSGEDRLTPCEYRIIRNDGEVIEVRTQGVIQRFNHKSAAVFATVQDITEQKRVEEELQNMEKLRSIGTLAGGIAHDFNNILTGVFGNLSIARCEIEPDHPAYPFMKEAENSLNRASRLTKQLLTFSKGGAPVKELTTISDLIQEVIRFDLSGSRVKPVFHIDEHLWIVEVDKSQIQQVFSNITINANQAMPDGGQLYVSMNNEVAETNPVHDLKPGNFVKITVRDEGSGIDPKLIGKIFEPYFSTKQTGNGLGLATVYSIIQKHNGHIDVESELGIGTTFTIYIPASDIQFKDHQMDTGIFSQIQNQNARILVMDDEEVIRKLLIKLLCIIGYEVETVADGKQAVEAYQNAMNKQNPFNAVIMDITIPGGMGGEEAVKHILAMDPNAKCIVSSGYANDPIMANYLNYGFKGIAPKPYTIEEIKDVLHQVLNG